MATIMYPSLQKSQSMRSKRKSAVELLAESKAYYVKSEMVRDSHQVMPLRLSSGSCIHSTATLRPRQTYIPAPHQIPSNIPGWRPMSMAQCKYHYFYTQNPRMIKVLKSINFNFIRSVFRQFY